MVRYPLIRTILAGAVLAAGASLFSGCGGYEYAGPISLDRHPWLKGKKIFIDPGHGGAGGTDLFRQGPNGITEEEVNLKVGVILEHMLKKAGATVAMTRTRDKDVPLDERISMAHEFGPDVLVSIHHNGSARRADGVNYPSVLIWGSREVKPESYDLASKLLEEFHKIMDERGSVISDHAVFHETGTRILNRTSQLCPGVLGEGGFFSDEKHARRLADVQYLESEAGAYFTALSRYFQWGVPDAEVIFSCPMKGGGLLSNEISDTKPRITIRIMSGNEYPGIKEETFKVTLDGVSVGFKKIADDMFLLKYGDELYPGGHSIRFSFRNQRGQSSMILRAPFTVSIRAGDRNRLVSEGRRLVGHRKTARKGLHMLLSALSMSQTDPEAGKIVSAIVSGFRSIGDTAGASYYEQALVSFYPDSVEAKKIRTRVLGRSGCRFPADFNGRIVKIKAGKGVSDKERKTSGNAFQRIKKFFNGHKPGQAQ